MKLRMRDLVHLSLSVYVLSLNQIDFDNAEISADLILVCTDQLLCPLCHKTTWLVRY
jgi:hypothetical protein